MALSNWDTLSFTMNGPSLDGVATNHESCTLEIYKNWVIATAEPPTPRPKWWNQLREATPRQDLVRLQHGQLSIGQWQITAQRGPQAGIYIVASSARWADTPSPDNDAYHDKAILVGCGVYGYSEPSELYRDLAVEVGVDPDTLMTSADADGRQLVGLRDGQLVVLVDDLPDSEWTGVLPESVVFLKALVDEVADEGGWAEDVLRALPWDQAERCNQGDRYFGEHGVDVPEPTAPGAANPPLLHQLTAEP